MRPAFVRGAMEPMRLLALTLAALLLAGCANDAAPEPDAEDEGFPDTDPTPRSPAAEDDVEETPATRLQAASDRFEDEPRYAIEMVNREDANATRVTKGFTDREANTSFLHMEHLRMGEMHKLEIVGHLDRSVFRCDKDACVVTGEADVTSDMAGGLVVTGTWPTISMQAGLLMLQIAAPTVSEEEFEGVDAWRQTYEMGETTTTVWLAKDPVRYLRVETTSASGASTNLTFDYGDDATLDPAAPRAATLALLSAHERAAYTRLAQGYGDGTPAWNFTIANASVAPRVPLADVTLRAEDRYEEGLEMPLEDGSASDERMLLAFEDTDGDGLVGPGDVVRVEILSVGDNRFNPFGVEDLDIALVDEKGWTVAAR